MTARNLYLIYGSDDYLVSHKARSVVQTAAPAGTDAQIERIDGAVDKVETALMAIRKTLMALNSIGLFSEEKTVWLENATFLADTRTGQSAAVQEEIPRLIDRIKTGIPPGVTFIITAPGVDKRRAFFKACKVHAEIHEFDVPDDSRSSGQAAVDQSLTRFIIEKGLTMTPAARNAFLQKVGPDSRLILGEVEKLAVALGTRVKVEIDDVIEFVSSSREAVYWDLADAFAGRDLPRALHTLRQLLFQRQNMMGLMINLEKRIRELMIYREGIDQKWLVRGSGSRGGAWNWAELPPDVERIFAGDMENDPRKIHPFRIGIIAGQALKFTRKRLEYCLKQAVTAHENMVSSRVPPELTLELLLVRMLSTPRRMARSDVNRPSVKKGP